MHCSLYYADRDSTQLSYLISGPCYHAGFHNLKQVFKTPLHRLHAQLSPVQGSSKTEPSIPRTFREILPRSEFVSGACQLEESLDDVECEYRIPSTTILQQGSALLQMK